MTVQIFSVFFFSVFYFSPHTIFILTIHHFVTDAFTNIKMHSFSALRNPLGLELWRYLSFSRHFIKFYISIFHTRADKDSNNTAHLLIKNTNFATQIMIFAKIQKPKTNKFLYFTFRFYLFTNKRAQSEKESSVERGRQRRLAKNKDRSRRKRTSTMPVKRSAKQKWRLERTYKRPARRTRSQKGWDLSLSALTNRLRVMLFQFGDLSRMPFVPSH